MDKKLQLIAHLYGEAENPSELEELLRDPALKEEYEHLTEAKYWLDHTKKESPSDDVLANIAAFAAQPSTGATSEPEPVLREDRPAAPRMRLVTPRYMRIAASLVLLCGAVYVLWPSDSSLNSVVANQEASEMLDQAEKSFSADADAAPVLALEEEARSDDRLEGGRIASDLMPAAAPLASRADAGLSLANDTIPSWDDSDIHSVRKRIEALMQQNESLGWDNPVVPLDQLPSSSATTFRSGRIQQAGSARRNPN